MAKRHSEVPMLRRLGTWVLPAFTVILALEIGVLLGIYYMVAKMLQGLL